MRNLHFSRFFLIVLLLTCASCVNTPPQVMQMYTEAASTVIAGVEQTQNVTPQGDVSTSNLPGEMITGATVTPIILPIEHRGATQVIPEIPSSVSSGSVATVVSATASKADSVTVSSYSPASGSVVLPAEAFYLTIILYNSGSTTWQTTYKIIDYSDTSLAVNKTIYLPYAVAPGSTVPISIYMSAPTRLGSYNSNFMIQDASGVTFGYFDYVLTVGDHSVITSIPTLTATITPTYYSAAGITATPDSLAWNCIDRERSKNYDCENFCLSYANQFPECYNHGEQVSTPTPLPTEEATAVPATETPEVSAE